MDEKLLYSIVEKAQKYDKLMESRFPQKKYELQCSFCGKSESAVEKLVVGDNSGTVISICDECIKLCVEILDKPIGKQENKIYEEE